MLILSNPAHKFFYGLMVDIEQARQTRQIGNKMTGRASIVLELVIQHRSVLKISDHTTSAINHEYTLAVVQNR